MKEKIETGRYLVTPEVAEEWLKHNEGNRKINNIKVRMYTDSMINGKWYCSNDAISFDHKGKLINGQHRLMAVVASRTPQEFLVATDIKPDVNMDRPYIRTVANNLQIFTEIDDVLGTTQCVAIVKWIMEMNGKSVKAINVSEVVDFMEHWERELVEFIKQFDWGGKEHGNKLRNACVASAYFVAYINGVPMDKLNLIAKIHASNQVSLEDYNILSQEQINHILRYNTEMNNKFHSRLREDRKKGYLLTQSVIDAVVNNRNLFRKRRKPIYCLKAN